MDYGLSEISGYRQTLPPVSVDYELSERNNPFTKVSLAGKNVTTYF